MIGVLKRVLVMGLVPAALFVALASWGLSSPVGSSPDDDFHLASIWCGQGVRAGLCEAGNSANERRVPAPLVEYSSCYAFHPEASPTCPQKPSTTLVNTDRGNFNDGLYPPVYYAVMSIFASESIYASTVAMRLFNALFFVLSVSSLFLLLPRTRRGPLMWGALVSIVPLGMFLVPSVNPSSWAILSAATLWVALLGYFTATGRNRRIGFAAIAALMTVVGAGARSDSAVYGVLAMLVVLALAFEASKRYALLAILPAALAVVSVVLYSSTGQASVVNPNSFAGTTSDAVFSLTMTNFRKLPELWAGGLGTWGLGWLDTALPGSVWVTMLAVYAGTVFLGLRRMSWRKAVAFSTVFGSLIVVPLYVLVHDRVIVGQYIQPRYIYPLLILFAGIALVQVDRDDLRMTRPQTAIIGSLVTLANSIALHVNIRRYVTGLDVDALNLNRGAEWWWIFPIPPMSPFSPLGVWAIGTLSFGLAVLGIAVYSRRSARSGRRPLTAVGG
ncbi:DUF2142 domain-containing protein [Cryobacterium sp. HLT2-28]|uniref:DUF2142 domain-containing protein n=1 Tax=Cryobacterium sp. HLT2-28 TaxID=1259146 RepID=UPI00106C1CB6|nr:DUF2142 domain-containing protein [Cryobacterium sp. HLT2-28]TFB91039.1 DUF2142 domain-containing protein [Cryobacterium sp. HLT2-28]